MLTNIKLNDFHLTSGSIFWTLVHTCFQAKINIVEIQFNNVVGQILERHYVATLVVDQRLCKLSRVVESSTLEKKISSENKQDLIQR